MKTKQQKKEELKKAEEMLEDSQALLFADFSRLGAEEMRALRDELRITGARLMVIKKRLLEVLFKEKGIDYDPMQFESWVGTIFSPSGAEEVGGPLYRFFKDLNLGSEDEKIDATKKILGGYDVSSQTAISQETLFMIGQLPPREALLAQLLGVLTGPLRALMYLLNEKSAQGEGGSDVDSEASDSHPEVSETETATQTESAESEEASESEDEKETSEDSGTDGEAEEGGDDPETKPDGEVPQKEKEEQK